MNKFIFGMAKFNEIKYGIGKSKNITNIDESINLLNFIYFKRKIKNFELSLRYNKSIPLLSSFIKKNNCKTKIFYKIDNLKSTGNNFDILIDDLKKIKEKLNINKFENISLHQNDYKIISNKKIIKFLEKIKRDEISKTVGTSIYSKKELMFSITTDVYDTIQLPVNPLNTYLYNLYKKQNTKKIIIARSIFLQGALLNELKNHKFKNEINNEISIIKNIANKNNIFYKKLIFNFVKNLKSIDYILSGSTNIKNLNKLFQKKIRINQEIINSINQSSNKETTWNNIKNWN